MDLEDLSSELKSAEDKTKKSLLEVARLNEDIRREQDRVNQVEKAKHNLENVTKDLQLRLDETEGHVLKGGKKLIQKLEHRVSETLTEMCQRHRKFCVFFLTKNGGADRVSLMSMNFSF